MLYPINSSVILDVTKPPYCADNTGKTDCTEVLKKILDDLMQREIDGVNASYDELVELSENGKKTVYIGFENRVYDPSRIEVGVNVLYPKITPDAKIIYFPKGTYLVSDTVTYSFDNLKNIYLSNLLSELCRSIHIMGESAETTVIKLKDNSKGFEKGNNKPVISFVNVPDCMTRKCSNVCQNNTLEDITIDCGNGNEGAVGFRFMSINSGKIDNVTVIGNGSYCGAELATNNTASIVNLKISGFDYGIHTPYSHITVIDSADLSGNRIAAIKTCGSKLTCKQINSGNIPTFEFYDAGRTPEDEQLGVYYLADKAMTVTGELGLNKVYYESTPIDAADRTVPKNVRSSDKNDWVCVDDFGAVADGVTDCTEAIQRAMNSGKEIVIFGTGHYLINDVITIPATVKTVDFMYCDLFSGDKLVNTKNGGVFEINEASDDILFIENLYTFEQFYGYLRLIKHAAKRDLVLKSVHNQASATYFNTVGGSRVYMDNCASTTGSYAYNCVLAKDIPYDDYSVVIPYEFHNQKVYGMQINPERAHTEMLNDGSDIILDAYKIEGPGRAIKSINGGKTVINMGFAAIGYIYADNALFDTESGNVQITGMVVCDAPSWKKLRYKYFSDTAVADEIKRINIEQITEMNNYGRRINYFNTNEPTKVI